MDDALVLSLDELHPIHVDREEGGAFVTPHALVGDGEEGAAVKGELFDAREVPDLSLQLCFPTCVILRSMQHKTYVNIHKL